MNDDLRKRYQELKQQREREAVVDLMEIRADHFTQTANLPKKYIGKTLDDFDLSDNDQRIRWQKAKAVDMCKDYLGNWRTNLRDGRGLVFTGKLGTGKTMLLSIIVGFIASRGRAARYATENELVENWHASFRDFDRGSGYLKKLQDYDLLVIDEIGVSTGDPEKVKNFLSGVIDKRYRGEKATLYGGNLDITGIGEYLGTRVADRIIETTEWIDMSRWSSYRHRMRVQRHGD